MKIHWKKLGFLICFASVALADGAPVTRGINLTKAYIPNGFDDNDRVQVAVESSFGSTCFRVGPTNTTVDKDKKIIHINQQVYWYEGICWPMIVPFDQVVTLGLLEAGNYTLVDDNSGKELGKLAIDVAKNSGPDDFLYAPIEDASVMWEDNQPRHTVMLEGSFRDSCFTLSDVKVTVSNDVIVMQPILNPLSETKCQVSKTRFSKMVKLPPGLKGSYLLHVRSLNGNAINKLIDLD